MNRRYRSHRKNGNYTIPMVSLGIVAAAILLWVIIAKGDDILRYFEGETIYYPDNSEANANLSRLLADLSGDKAQLLSLAENSQVRLGWIKDEQTRRHFRWILMTRLLDKGLWDEAVRILPEVEDIASLPNLERLAEAALDHEDYELQLRLDRKIQDIAVHQPSDMELLLRSIRRTAETCIKMHNQEEAVKAISRLDEPALLARLSTPQLAAEAADLQMLRVDVSTVKEHALQLVRNILEQANWPPCLATSRLMLEEVSTALNDNPALTQSALKEIEQKLLHCRDGLLEYSDKEHKLPQCYLILGELRLRLGDYAGCSQALTLANAFAEGYGMTDLDWQLMVARLRAKANMSRGAKTEALEDCLFLAEHESSPEQLMTALTFLSANSPDSDREKYLSRLWTVMQAQPSSSREDKIERARIASEIASLNAENGAKEQAVKWGTEAMHAAQVAYPDLSDGKALRASLKLALLQRKKGDDTQAMRRLRDIVRVIEGMEQGLRQKLDSSDKTLYATAVREYARTCLITGDRDLARIIIRKIHEDLPEKKR